ncbi:hypothetical protein [Burkholderia stagnalis]|uniref:hypothetical protein n=1 Tax=Burkholderia stagnalis TaxID=1503054 RepID=UPI000F581BF7|nr:hypothetical protein [Burkholderia stagnalis]RQR11254.1 hypothetical protein DF025_16920 [Burkholderia stagnalis]RQR20283.1 hypothetical protein DF026_16725 [Burkholderia stagnalis]
MKIARGHVSDAIKAIRQRPAISAAIAAAIAATAIAVYSLDFSRALTPREIGALRQFVIDTDSPTVRRDFNRGIRDGQMTVARARDVVETAKAQAPRYGLASDRQ